MHLTHTHQTTHLEVKTQLRMAARVGALPRIAASMWAIFREDIAKFGGKDHETPQVRQMV